MDVIITSPRATPRMIVTVADVFGLSAKKKRTRNIKVTLIAFSGSLDLNNLSNFNQLRQLVTLTCYKLRNDMIGTLYVL